MNISSGVRPFDERVGGLRRGGIHLLAGGPGSGRFTFILQALDAGLRDGERVALLTGSAPDEVLAQVEHWGFDIASHWREGRCVIIGFRGEYPTRILHAADPGEAFGELDALLDAPIARLGIDPGSFLWETRAGTAMAQRFLDWCAATRATVLATVPSGLEDSTPPATEWVLQRASGVFRFARLSSGLHEVSVERSTPPIDVSGPITLELVPGAGLAAPTGRRDRRRGAGGDRPPTDRLLLLRLNDGMPTDLEAWLGRGFSVTEVTDPLDLVSRVQSEPAGVICVYAEPESADEAIRTCRSVRALSSAVLLVLSERPLRAADRARAIDAGADDVLAHDIDLRELEARLRRAAETGTRRQPAEERPRPEPVDRLLGAEEMSSEVAGRLGAEALSVFSLLLVSGPDEEMGARLLESVRTDQGDLVGRAVDGWAVLLQDARAGQAEAFLRRVRDALGGTGSGRRLEAEILSSPAQADRIRAVVGA